MRVDAEAEAEKARQRLLARRGASAAVKSGPNGAADYGKNAQFTGLSSGTQTTLGAGA
jgi:hypothetical protein